MKTKAQASAGKRQAFPSGDGRSALPTVACRCVPKPPTDEGKSDDSEKRHCRGSRSIMQVSPQDTPHHRLSEEKDSA
jgi:hypothetical protein